jgi:LPS-assembly protein
MEKGSKGLLRTVLQLKKIIHIFAIVALLAPLALAHGADEDPLPWEVTADQITHEQEPEKIIAEGKVFLQQYKGDSPTGLKIEADRALYNINENLINISGNLHLFEKNNEVRASEAQVQLENQTGFFKDASIFWEDSSLFVSADLIEKTAEQVYHFEEGKFTACPPEKDKAPDWSFRGRDVKITLDDYARLEHATFRIKDVPVLYLPYLRLPLGNEKKSGFLFPEYSSSKRNGTGVVAPFFINLSPSYDMTIYPGYYSDRGTVLAGEFRYAAGYKSRGTFMFNYLDDDLNDTLKDEYKSDGLLRTNSERYWFRGKADHDFGNRLLAKLDLDVVSDHDYLQEFKKGIIGFDQSNDDFLKVYKRGFQNETLDYRENTLQLSKIWSTTDLQTEVRIIDDESDTPNQNTPPWAVPRIAYSGLLPFLQTPIDLVWGTEYAYFWRDEGVGGHRVNLFPRLNGPIPLSPYLESSYQVGLRETLYFIEPHDKDSRELYDEDFESATLVNVLLTGATTLSKDYDIAIKNYTTFRHAIRPELSYLLVEDPSQDDSPVLDNEDRDMEKNWLKYSLHNYFRALNLDKVSLLQSNYSSLKIDQIYDIDAGDHPFSDIYLEFIIRGFQNLFLKYETSVSVYGEGVTSYSIETQYKNKRGDRVNLDYRYKRNQEISPPYFYSNAGGGSLSELSTNLEGKLSQHFSIKFKNTYSVSSTKTIDSSFSLIYNDPCWKLEFVANNTIDDTSFYVLFSLAGFSAL